MVPPPRLITTRGSSTTMALSTMKHILSHQENFYGARAVTLCLTLGARCAEGAAFRAGPHKDALVPHQVRACRGLRTARGHLHSRVCSTVGASCDSRLRRRLLNSQRLPNIASVGRRLHVCILSSLRPVWGPARDLLNTENICSRPVLDPLWLLYLSCVYMCFGWEKRGARVFNIHTSYKVNHKFS